MYFDTYLKIFLVIFLVRNSLSDIEFYCPKGWILHGQVVINKIISKTQSEYKHATYATCLICQKNAISTHDFKTVDFCIFDQISFRKGDQYILESVSCEHPLTSKSGECPKQNPFCGARIESSVNFENRIENMEFLPCSTNALFSNDINVVDLMCPENLTFSGIQQQVKTYDYLLNGRQWKARFTSNNCIVCNEQNKNSRTNYYCASTLSISAMKQHVSMALKSEESLSTCPFKSEQNCNGSQSENGFCGYKMKFAEKGIPIKEDHYISCKEEINEKIRLNNNTCNGFKSKVRSIIYL
jgi:hypothetical protein